MKFIAALIVLTQCASAFCGFYVAKADSKLFNKASKVVIARDGEQTVLTMANDYQGDLQEFAAVFPVPVVLQRDDIKVVPLKIVEHLDAYSAPRLVEYHDENPCQEVRPSLFLTPQSTTDAALPVPKTSPSKALRVKVEAEYDVDEYQIVILSAEDSGDLETWLTQEGYRIPKGAARVLGSYIRQNMKFFVAKVNLEKQSALGFTYLRPLQVRYQSKKFALPIRLGTVNAKGDQELLAYILSPDGRVECTNYKTVKLPTGMDLPVFVKDEFADFYRDMFYTQVAKHQKKAVFMEYGWDMGWCDPCAANPLSQSEQLTLGCDWILGGAPPAGSPANYKVASGETLFGIARKHGVTVKQLKTANRLRSDRITAGQALVIPRREVRPSGPRKSYVTRLHVVYNAETFPEDLVFQGTADRQNFQGRYVLRHPWKGDDDCERARTYRDNLAKRQAERVESLVELTGWDLEEVRKKTFK